MKRLLILFSILALTGCAHATIHQICSNPDTLEKYKDYDECYAEETANRAAKRQRHLAFMRSINNGGNNINCSSIQNGNFISTNCH